MTRLGLLVVLLLALAAPAGTARPAPAGEHLGRQVLVVDDDGVQCPQADFGSVQDAIAAAEPGALVRVCPGAYAELVTVDTPLTLLGLPESVDALDCFAPQPSLEDDLDPATYPILQRPAGRPGNLVTVTAPGVTVAGLVLQGARTVVPEGPSIYDAAVLLRPGSAPARVRHNLVRLNDLGIDVGGGDETAATRVDHNCLRDNRWGLASQRADFVGGRVDHNGTYRHEFFGYEVGWSQQSTRHATYDDNVSRRDGTAFYVANSASVTITGNDIAGGTGSGIQLLPSEGLSSGDVVVAGNEVSGMSIGIGIGTDAMARPAVLGALVEGNTLTGNRIGLSLQRANRDVVVRGNLATDNVQYGMWSRPLAAGHLFEGNTMLGNGVADARDDNRAQNTWTGNVCVTDLPPGTICGQ